MPFSNRTLMASCCSWFPQSSIFRFPPRCNPARALTPQSIHNGIATIEMPGGGVLQARGEATQGQRVFVRDGLIEGPAPELEWIEGEV
jgi:hypothetical protein